MSGLTDVKAQEPATKAVKTKAVEAEPVKAEAAKHPSGLSGIDLSIWKAEQKEKNK
jgi:hypothetical protein